MALLASFCDSQPGQPPAANSVSCRGLISALETWLGGHPPGFVFPASLCRRKIRSVFHELKFLRREVAIATGVDFPLPRIRGHATQRSNYVLHFRSNRRKLAFRRNGSSSSVTCCRRPVSSVLNGRR